MPFVVTKVNGKKFPFPQAIFLDDDVERWRGGDDVYEVVNIVTRRKQKVGGKRSGASEPKYYTPSLCNHPHNLKTGRPVKHQCRTIPPATPRAWREKGM